jgi:hypothetical protein
MSKIFFAFTILCVLGSVFSSVCRDGSTCPGTTTCCLTTSGVGCCPYENASCCSDGLHCCPNGYQCDVNKGSCVTKEENKFMAFVSLSETAPASLTESMPMVGFSIDPKDLLKCLEDIKPVAIDIYTAITEYKKGTPEGKQKALAALLDLTTKGVIMGTDCYKVISQFLKKD